MACVILSLYFMYGISHDDFSVGGERRFEKLVVYWLIWSCKNCKKYFEC